MTKDGREKARKFPKGEEEDQSSSAKRGKACIMLPEAMPAFGNNQKGRPESPIFGRKGRLRRLRGIP